ncbi:MAG TPA: hypothetical protein VGC32_00875 [Solirubrobacterales bacterium]
MSPRPDRIPRPASRSAEPTPRRLAQLGLAGLLATSLLVPLSVATTT